MSLPPDARPMRDETADAAAWHGFAAEQALSRLGATPAGLTRGEAARRLAEHGPNMLSLIHI